MEQEIETVIRKLQAEYRELMTRVTNLELFTGTAEDFVNLDPAHQDEMIKQAQHMRSYAQCLWERISMLTGRKEFDDISPAETADDFRVSDGTFKQADHGELK